MATTGWGAATRYKSQCRKSWVIPEDSRGDWIWFKNLYNPEKSARAPLVQCRWFASRERKIGLTARLRKTRPHAEAGYRALSHVSRKEIPCVIKPVNNLFGNIEGGWRWWGHGGEETIRGHHLWRDVSEINKLREFRSTEREAGWGRDREGWIRGRKDWLNPVLAG